MAESLRRFFQSVQGQLFALVGMFIVLVAISLTLSPAVITRTWEADYLLTHWAGVIGWLISFSGILFFLQRYQLKTDPILIPVIALLTGWGLLTIFSISIRMGLKQTLWMILGSAALILVVNPIRSDGLGPSSGMGMGALWAGWLLLAATLLLLIVRSARPAWMMLLLLVLFGPGFVQVQQSLAQRFLRQRGEAILYPWVEFREAIEAAQPETIAVAPEVWKVYRMVGQRSMRRTIARTFFRQRDLDIPKANKDWSTADLAIAGPKAFREWTQQEPGLGATATFDASGRITLVRPGIAGQKTPD